MTESPASFSEHVSNIADPLEEITRAGHDHYSVFDDWVSLIVAAFQRDDKTYNEVLSTYTERDHGSDNAPELFAEALGELVTATEETETDILGDAYEEFGASHDGFGQHFTPHPVSRMMAQLQMTGDDDPDPPITVADPACGSGRLLVHAAQQSDKEVACYGTDKDKTCAKMAAINLFLFDIPGTVVHGDSLTLNQHQGWQIVRTPFGPRLTDADKETVEQQEAALA
jgi:type I restriction-modification system DNA methylase subunit